MNFIKCKKRAYRVSVRKPAISTPAINQFHNSNAVTTEQAPYIITGTVGEEWCVSRYVLLRSYVITEHDADTLGATPFTIWSRDDAPIVEAAILPIADGQFAVQTPGGDTLCGNAPGIDHAWGDFVVADGDDMWIINGRVFMNTYQLVT